MLILSAKNYYANIFIKFLHLGRYKLETLLIAVAMALLALYVEGYLIFFSKFDFFQRRCRGGICRAGDRFYLKVDLLP
ncbi:MAG: hypothetical protein EAZ88_13685 [Oscillatoriales cyanobacterium]|jgi:hypothetical protein|nr:MAG: hypothetical protein EAZ88_13685 [Oscillatoriales cyanobacterium]TAG42993.1 MAG: hypothetical protein EAZ33_13870 [Oscillatoriales cyanobacterium]TAG72724.1 MAG: hypothetical protein EAZ23_13190 [Oscillatoriales cyanobacterium]